MARTRTSVSIRKANRPRLNEVAFEGATPLALAAEVNNIEAIKVLVEGGRPDIATRKAQHP